MKLATVRLNEKSCVVVVDSEKGRVWPVADVFAAIPPQCAFDMVAAITYLAGVSHDISLPGEGIALSDVVIEAPVKNPPRNIMCVGKNYRAHAHEFANSGFDTSAGSAAEAIPQHPIIFSKPQTSISGPQADIPMFAGLDTSMDYEAELAVIIGKGGRNIKREDAMDHVFGYTIVNDVTARDLQSKHKQWLLGKGIDGFCPMGPWVVTRDELQEDTMRVSCRVNGELRQDSKTDALIFDIPTLIETISLSTALVPGDIIATGTPEGVGIGFNPPKFLQEGDVVECEISGIGIIRNTVRRSVDA
jgi:2-keto-4-pentenoate hydratase/2-oxohepta-3-ene-1,7-dioic acid hydratase in catechol pathway